MGKCQKCGQPDVNNSGRCAKHPKTNLEKQNEQKQAQIKLQMAKKLEEEKEKREAMAAKATKIQEAAAAKAKKINEIVVQWNGQVKAVVTQVLNLRKAHPGVEGINAGNNAVGNTAGGTNNPVAFVMPSNDFNIARAEVFAKMAGFDS